MPAAAPELIEEYRQGTRPPEPEDGPVERTLDSPTSAGLSRPAPAESRTGKARFDGGRPARVIAVAAAILGAAGAVLMLGVVLGREPGDRRPTGSPPSGGPPPGAVRPPQASGRPAITLNQTYGDGDTGFVVSGTGFAPGREVTIRLDTRPASPYPPVVDFGGAFNYTLNQSHEFFPGKIPPGPHHVTVTVAGTSRQLAAAFTVNRL